MNDSILTINITGQLLLTIGVLLGALGFHLGTYGAAHFRLWLANRRFTLANKAALAQARERFALRLKGKIIKVGTVSHAPDGTLQIGGDWEIDCQNNPFIPAFSHGPDGECCHAGWTHEELAEIAKRGKEFA